MKTMWIACTAALLAVAAAWATTGTDATNTVSLTDVEVRMVERSRARRAKAEEATRKATARQRVEAIANTKTDRTLLINAQLGPHVGTRQTAAAIRQMVPKTVYNRRRVIGMDTESVPGYCVYTYAQGGNVWCETNALQSIDFRAARNRYSKLKIVVAAKAAGKWDALKAGLAAADLADEWAACQYIEDGDSSFVAATNAVVAAGVATAEEIAAFLKSAIDN